VKRDLSEYKDLKDFLYKAALNGYGTPNAITEDSEDGSHTVTFVDGDFKSVDKWIGGEPYAGNTIISHKGKIVWAMTYFGSVRNDVLKEDVYEILHPALQKVEPEFPIRGPLIYQANNKVYRSKLLGTKDWEDASILSFVIEETIWDTVGFYENSTDPIYKAQFHGGLVNLF
jgi:hypothetical protein